MFMCLFCPGRKSTQTFSGQSSSRTLRVMDVRAENCGRPHQKVRFPAAPVTGRNVLTPRASGRKGQERLQEVWTRKFMFMLFFFPDLNAPFLNGLFSRGFSRGQTAH